MEDPLSDFTVVAGADVQADSPVNTTATATIPLTLAVSSTVHRGGLKVPRVRVSLRDASDIAGPRARTQWEPGEDGLHPTSVMTKTTNALIAFVLIASAGCQSARQAEESTTNSPSRPDVSTCATLMQAQYEGQLVSLSNCAALLGLRPTPRIDLAAGETLTLVAPITNNRPPVPTSTNPRILRFVQTGSGTTLGTFKADGWGTVKLIIQHPAEAVCIGKPTARCVVASVTVRGA
jgi:hypothetical protein